MLLLCLKVSIIGTVSDIWPITSENLPILVLPAVPLKFVGTVREVPTVIVF